MYLVELKENHVLSILKLGERRNVLFGDQESDIVVKMFPIPRMLPEILLAMQRSTQSGPC